MKIYIMSRFNKLLLNSYLTALIDSIFGWYGWLVLCFSMFNKGKLHVVIVQLGLSKWNNGQRSHIFLEL